MARLPVLQNRDRKPNTCLWSFLLASELTVYIPKAKRLSDAGPDNCVITGVQLLITVDPRNHRHLTGKGSAVTVISVADM